jgi:hypothetical protein
MVKKKTKAAVRKSSPKETDSAYFFKIVLYLIIGSQWIRLVDPELTRQIPIPLGFIIGMFFASHDHFKIDRKIEYALLTVGMFIGFWVQAGIYITVLK